MVGCIADLAKQHSDDIASRDTGSDLGFAPKEHDPAFEKALDELSVNTVSQPIETQLWLSPD